MKTSLVLGLALSFCQAFGQADKPECIHKTVAFFTTFDGFYIERCKESEFGSYRFELDGASRIVEKQGKFRQIFFRKKSDNQRKVSGLQIIQNHVNAIKSVKGEVVSGSKDRIYRTTYQGNDLWIEVLVYHGKEDVDNFSIVSVESQSMKQEVSALGIKDAIDRDGKMALYNILFDTGKSDIKSESEKELKEVAAFLQSNPTLSIYIVGHTDNVGSFNSNLTLSKSRGESVKQYLITKHSIDPKRLAGEGVGSLSPVSSNDSEEGRKLNRRVEIVKK
jgi:outer membrane protein OmpA-like peptidoglycan-associated protein